MIEFYSSTGRGSYVKYPKKEMPHISWHVRENRPTFLDYKTSGSYIGRHKNY